MGRVRKLYVSEQSDETLDDLAEEHDQEAKESEALNGYDRVCYPSCRSGIDSDL